MDFGLAAVSGVVSVPCERGEPWPVGADPLPVNRGSPEVLLTPNNLAMWLERSGRVADAIEQYMQLLVDQRRVHHPDAPRVLLTRNNLAQLAELAGDPGAPIRAYEDLITDLVRVLEGARR